jgi:hypothetical protein
MTAQKLLGILKLIENVDGKLNLQGTLDSIKDALSNLASSPAQPQYQTTLASALQAFSQAAAKLGEMITPAQALAIKEMGGAEFFDPAIADKVKNSVQTNAMTPSVARDFVQGLATRRAAFLKTVASARQNLVTLEIKESTLQPGSADISFLIPRDIFDNHLDQFSKELNFISRLIQDFTEAQTAQAEPVELEQLSSSTPAVSLITNPAVISLLGLIVTKFLEAWARIERIRKIRGELTEIGMKGKAVEELTEQITTTVNQVVEESTELVIAKYPGNPARKNELTNAITQDTQRLFGQIERGLTIEFRAEPKTGDGEQQKQLENITNLAKTLQFPEVPKEPMLLKSGEVVEGEVQILKHSKKTTTTTQKTSTSTKTSQKDARDSKEPVEK